MGKRRRMVDTHVPEHEEDVGPSRSKQRAVRKDQQGRLESLANQLAELSDRARARLELDEPIEREVRALALVDPGSAMARQRRRVATLLRALDLDDLEARVHDVVIGANAAAEGVTRRLERLRDQLLEGDDALEPIFDEHPTIDRPRLHQAVRAARREAEAGPRGRRYKQLLKLLRELGLGQPPPPTDG